MVKAFTFVDRWLLLMRGARSENENSDLGQPNSGIQGFAETQVKLDWPTDVKSNKDIISKNIEEPIPLVSAKDTVIESGLSGHRERMRERVLRHGAASLADYELLEMLLFFVFKKGDTKRLAKILIKQFGSFSGLLSAPISVLQETKSLGPHAVAALKLVQEVGSRLTLAEIMNRPLLGNWDRLINYLTTVMAHEKIEQFRILFLDTRNNLIADECQARGTVNHTPVYPREVVKRALELHATAIILAHNHPSGDPTPSRADIEMTTQISEACAALGVLLHDHVIIGNGTWLSFRKEGLLQ